MKILKLETEKPCQKGKIRAVSIDQKMIARIGSAIYGNERVKDVIIKVGFKDGSVVAFQRDEEEDEDELEKEKRKRRKHRGDDE